MTNNDSTGKRPRSFERPGPFSSDLRGITSQLPSHSTKRRFNCQIDGVFPSENLASHLLDWAESSLGDAVEAAAAGEWVAVADFLRCAITALELPRTLERALTEISQCTPAYAPPTRVGKGGLR